MPQPEQCKYIYPNVNKSLTDDSKNQLGLLNSEILETLVKPEKPNSVGLSYSANLTATEKEIKSGEWNVSLKIYEWGETSITTNKHLPNPTCNLPKNFGERTSNALTKKGKSRIRKAANYYQSLTEKKGTKGFASMLTLSYGKKFPNDKISKKHLDSFFKRLRRHLNIKDVHYCWVAERQKRGAIHYHILTPHYVDKNWVNDNWNGVVNSYWQKEEKPQNIQTLYPNVIAVYNAGAYLTKYLQKEGQNISGNGYNMSQTTSQAIKPIFNESIRLQNFEMVNEVANDLKIMAQRPEIKTFTHVNDFQNTIWLSKISNPEEITTTFLEYQKLNLQSDYNTSISNLESQTSEARNKHFENYFYGMSNQNERLGFDKEINQIAPTCWEGDLLIAPTSKKPPNGANEVTGFP
jgi:hypothetical protein|tara:strand:- start:573 stop:1793 length:1221 start_codon:yes stop_codon:yes gene_type:complete